MPKIILDRDTKQVLQQGHNQLPAQVPTQALIDKYKIKRIDKCNIR